MSWGYCKGVSAHNTRVSKKELWVSPIHGKQGGPDKSKGRSKETWADPTAKAETNNRNDRPYLVKSNLMGIQFVEGERW